MFFPTVLFLASSFHLIVAPTPHALTEQTELRKQIEAGLAALPEEYRAVLILREMHQCSYDEIADILDLDLGTVKSRINRGRASLKALLSKMNLF